MKSVYKHTLGGTFDFSAEFTNMPARSPAQCTADCSRCIVPCENIQPGLPFELPKACFGFSFPLLFHIDYENSLLISTKISVVLTRTALTL